MASFNVSHAILDARWHEVSVFASAYSASDNSLHCLPCTKETWLWDASLVLPLVTCYSVALLSLLALDHAVYLLAEEALKVAT